jgi:hypothetical protein
MDLMERVRQLEAKVKAGKPTRVTREFVQQFDAVCQYYQCPPDEVALMKEAARKDMENAKVCFASVYGSILAAGN